MDNRTPQAWADYADQEAHKLLSGIRESYIRQSAATRDGIVAPFVYEDPYKKPAHDHL